MDIIIPEIPSGILTLLAFFAPYAIALLNRPEWSGGQRKVIAIIASIVLAVVVWVLYFALTGEGLYEWPKMIILSVAITQASYALVTEPSAKRLEAFKSSGADS